MCGSPFFDPRGLVQVKYELLRRVRVDGYSVAQATSLFALSRPTFYAAHAAWEQAGIAGLLPQPTGPRHAHKLTEELMVQLRPLAKTMSAPQLAEWVQQQQQHLKVHPRSSPCPQCAMPSFAIHSSYHRHPRDLPCIGRPIRLVFTVRKFFCRNPDCSRKVFAEKP